MAELLRLVGVGVDQHADEPCVRITVLVVLGDGVEIDLTVVVRVLNDVRMHTVPVETVMVLLDFLVFLGNCKRRFVPYHHSAVLILVVAK